MSTTVNHNNVLASPREIVHLNPETLPPRPSDEWTRFVCISDTHSRTFYAPDGDVFLHSGNLTNTEDYEMVIQSTAQDKDVGVVIAFESPICV